MKQICKLLCFGKKLLSSARKKCLPQNFNKTHLLGNLEFNYDINKIIKTTQAKETINGLKKLNVSVHLNVQLQLMLYGIIKIIQNFYLLR